MPGGFRTKVDKGGTEENRQTIGQESYEIICNE